MTAHPASKTLSVEIPARSDYVSFVRVVVAAAADGWVNLAPDRIEDLKLAVSEATTNAINASRRAGRSDVVRLRCTADPDQIEVEVSDRGAGFDRSDRSPLPEPEDPARLLHESGLGLDLIETLTDVFELDSGKDGTTVRIVVYSDRHRHSQSPHR